MRRWEVVIVGAGHAGVQVAHSLRECAFPGTVLLVSAEDEMPYERPPLSKGFLRSEVELDDFLLKPTTYWSANRIDLMLGTRVEVVDAESHRLGTSTQGEIEYGTLVWAAGAHARRPELEGIDLDGVFSLHSFGEADRLRRRIRAASRVAVVGGGHIGLEVAAACRSLGVEVSVIEAAPSLLTRVTCPTVSEFYEGMHREHGVDLRLGSSVNGFAGRGRDVCGVVVSGGDVISCDLVLVGVGITPSVRPLREAGAACETGVLTDERGATTLPDVYAAGDAAERVIGGATHERLESVPSAVAHGRSVAAAIAGAPAPKAGAPWFWSHQYDTKWRTAGLTRDYDEEVVLGDPHTGAFSVVYLANGRMVAIDCINRASDFVHGRRAIESGMIVDPDVLRNRDAKKLGLLTK